MKLIEFTNGSDHPFGNKKGQETYSKLKDYFDQNNNIDFNKMD